MGQQETEQHSYDQRKLQQQEKRDVQRKSDTRRTRLKKIPSYALAAAIAGFLAWGAWMLIRSSAPEGPDLSTAYPIVGQEHIQVGASHPPYNSNPPTSGWHYANPAPTDFYDAPLPDETLVHNLEHGDIWIAYHPRISDSTKESLKKFLAPRIIIAPWEQNEFDISLVAWGRLDSFNIEENAFPEARTRDFIKRYTNKGPEKLSPMTVR